LLLSLIADINAILFLLENRGVRIRSLVALIHNIVAEGVSMSAYSLLITSGTEEAPSLSTRGLDHSCIANMFLD